MMVHLINDLKHASEPQGGALGPDSKCVRASSYRRTLRCCHRAQLSQVEQDGLRGLRTCDVQFAGFLRAGPVSGGEFDAVQAQ